MLLRLLPAGTGLALPPGPALAPPARRVRRRPGRRHRHARAAAAGSGDHHRARVVRAHPRRHRRPGPGRRRVAHRRRRRPPRRRPGRGRLDARTRRAHRRRTRGRPGRRRAGHRPGPGHRRRHAVTARAWSSWTPPRSSGCWPPPRCRDAPALDRLADGPAPGDVPALVRSGDGSLRPGMQLQLPRRTVPRRSGSPPSAPPPPSATPTTSSSWTPPASPPPACPPCPNTVWVDRPRRRPGRSTAGVAAADVVLRADVLRARRAAPLTAGLLRLARTAAATLLALGLLGLALGAAAGAPERWQTLTRLRTLGLRPRDARWVAAGELLPPVLVAAVGGPLLGAAAGPPDPRPARPAAAHRPGRRPGPGAAVVAARPGGRGAAGDGRRRGPGRGGAAPPGPAERGAPRRRVTGYWQTGWCPAARLVGDTGFEPVTSSVSRKRAPTAPIARGGCGNRTRVQGFAGPCLSHSANPPESLVGPARRPSRRSERTTGFEPATLTLAR